MSAASERLRRKCLLVFFGVLVIWFVWAMIIWSTPQEHTCPCQHAEEPKP